MNFISRYLLKYLLSCAQAEAIELKTILQSIPEARDQYLKHQQHKYIQQSITHPEAKPNLVFDTVLQAVKKHQQEVLKPYQRIERRLNGERVRGPNINVGQVVNILKAHDYTTIKGLARATGSKEAAMAGVLNRLRKKMPQHFRTYRKNLNGNSVLCFKWIP